MINRTILVGRMTRDPELRYTPSGVATCSFTLAVDRPFTNQQGERDADFIRITAWRKLAETVSNYLHKGSLVGVDGSIRTGSYENSEGRRVYTTEVNADSVEFLEPKGTQHNSGSRPLPHEPRSNSFSGGHGGGRQNEPFDDPFKNDGKPINITDDDLPF